MWPAIPYIRTQTRVTDEIGVGMGFRATCRIMPRMSGIFSVFF